MGEHDFVNLQRFTKEKDLDRSQLGGAAECKEIASGKKVVLKAISKQANPKFLNTFQKDTVTMCVLNHPNIAKFLDFYEENGFFCVLMEIPCEHSLKALLEEGPVAELDAVNILYQLLSALAAIHKKKIVHKDLKPSNILIDSEGNIKLVDYGIAKILEAEQNQEEMVQYSQDYGAPELFGSGKYDTKYDIFSTGVIAYQMLAGCLPFETKEQRLKSHFKQLPVQIDPFLAQIIAAMLNPNPRRRPTAVKLISSLEKEFGEVKKELTWSEEKDRLIVSNLGPIPNFPKYAPWRLLVYNIKALRVTRGIKEIGEFAFYYFYRLRELELHSDLRRIEGGAFMNCSQLKSLTIPKSVTFIGPSAFENCSSLESIKLPDTLTEIRNWTFYGCTKLQKINLKNVTAIAEDAFTKTPISVPKTTHIEEDPQFIYSLGMKYMVDTERLGNDKRGFSLLQMASDRGHAEATYQLALCVDAGRGTFSDKGEFIDLLRKASDAGHPQAMYALGMECKGQDSHEAFDLFKKAAKYNLKEASYELSLCYGIGRGVCKNKDEARRLYIEFSRMTLEQAKDLKWKQGSGVRWAFDELSQTLIIQGIHPLDVYTTCEVECKMEDHDYIGAPWKEIHDKIRSVIVCYGVTTIGRWSFEKCTRLMSVALPDNIFTIGRYAFKECSSLTSIIIPQSVVRIEENPFASCPNLHVTGLADNPNFSLVDDFLLNKDRTELILALPSISKRQVVPDTVKTINPSAFLGCKQLESISIPFNVTSIGEKAFSDCYRLTSIGIPESITVIQPLTFANCRSLESVNIPISIEQIKSQAFTGCHKLASIDFPNLEIALDGGAFEKCFSLTSFEIPPGIVSVYSSLLFRCIHLTSVTIPSSVESIGDFAFSGCYELASVELPERLKTIGKYSFSGCRALSEVVFPEHTTSVHEEAFAQCYELKSIKILGRFISFECSAFSECKKLRSVAVVEGFNIPINTFPSTVNVVTFRPT